LNGSNSNWLSLLYTLTAIYPYICKLQLQSTNLCIDDLHLTYKAQEQVSLNAAAEQRAGS